MSVHRYQRPVPGYTRPESFGDLDVIVPERDFLDRQDAGEIAGAGGACGRRLADHWRPGDQGACANDDEGIGARPMADGDCERLGKHVLF